MEKINYCKECGVEIFDLECDVCHNCQILANLLSIKPAEENAGRKGETK